MSYEEFYRKSLQDPVEFWKVQAQKLAWFTQPEQILSKNEEGLYRWYTDGVLNTSYLALDHHVQEGRGKQIAIFYDSPVSDTQYALTYAELLREVELFAGVLQHKGVVKGDRVVIYMPMIPQTAIAMLACARLGAIHSVVFGGFAPHELAIRIDDAEPKVIVTASCGIEIQKIIPYLGIVDEALKEATFPVESVIVYQRPQHPAKLQPGRDEDWQTLKQQAEPVACVPVKATDPLYILYTSGTTGKPKGVVRDNGGHAVALKLSMDLIYNIHAGDAFWAASDVGWVVGHSYIVYAPLIQGASTVLFEGKPVKTPDAGTFWRILEQYRVKSFFTAPTAIRAIRKEDPNGLEKEKYDTSSLNYLFLAGERCDISTLEWAQSLLQVPVIDHWWQTESGWPMLGNPAGMELLPIKPGSAGKPVCGFDLQILDPQGKAVAPGTEGAVAVRLPLPPGCLPTLWKNTARFIQSYLTDFPGYYFSGDGGYRDEEGYVFITGRMDDVINVAGHRLSTAEMEEVVAGHPDVAECAVVGIQDVLKGQIPMGLVVLKSGIQKEPSLIEQEIIQRVRSTIGPVASFKRVNIVHRLPKTRSGKILRKIIRSIADGREYAMPSTIEDRTVLPEIEQILNPEAS